MPVDLLSINTSLRRQCRSVLASLMTLFRFWRASSFQLGIVTSILSGHDWPNGTLIADLTMSAGSCRGRACKTHAKSWVSNGEKWRARSAAKARYIPGLALPPGLDATPSTSTSLNPIQCSRFCSIGIPGPLCCFRQHYVEKLWIQDGAAAGCSLQP